MDYEEPFYSNGQVDKAADRLLNTIYGSNDYKSELAIINQWRRSHMWPLDKVRHTLQNRSRTVDKDAVIVQRLKRLSSIENKLIRLPGTRIAGMQDIGGCRAIVANVDCVNRIVGLYEDARDRTRTDRSALIIDPRDHIASPQPTGYRGVHLVIRYQSNAPSTKIWTGRKIEIQIRTQLQHSWATALETVSTFLGQQLKANLGSPDWLRFFALASGVFAAKEECSPVPGVPVDDELYDETYDLWKRLNVESILQGCEIVGLERAENFKGMSVFVLKLDATERLTTVWGFDKKTESDAPSMYNEKEQEFLKRNDVDIVLVRTNDVRELESAYTNYWARTTEFRNVLASELASRLGIEIGIMD